MEPESGTVVGTVLARIGRSVDIVLLDQGLERGLSVGMHGARRSVMVAEVLQPVPSQNRW